MPTANLAATVNNEAAAAAVRAIWPRHAAKNIARLMDVAPATVRCWLYRGVSQSRSSELLAKIEAALQARICADIARLEELRLLREDESRALGGMFDPAAAAHRGGDAARPALAERQMRKR